MANMLLWLGDNRGVYIPQHFSESFADRAKSVAGVSDETWRILESGPDHEWYWEAWDDVCRDARVTDDNGQQYFVYQDGDCWLIPVEWEWNDDEQTFAAPAPRRS